MGFINIYKKNTDFFSIYMVSLCKENFISKLSIQERIFAVASFALFLLVGCLLIYRSFWVNHKFKKVDDLDLKNQANIEAMKVSSEKDRLFVNKKVGVSITAKEAAHASAVEIAYKEASTLKLIEKMLAADLEEAEKIEAAKAVKQAVYTAKASQFAKGTKIAMFDSKSVKYDFKLAQFDSKKASKDNESASISLILKNKEIKASIKQVSKLLQIFDDINFIKPNQLDYYDPKQLPKDMSPEKVKEGLKKFEEFIHLPTTDPINIYVQDYLSTLIEKLVFLTEEEKIKILIDLAHSGEHYCPANQRATIQQALLQVTNQEHLQANQSLEDRLKHLITQFKRCIFYQIAEILLKEKKIPESKIKELNDLGYYTSQIYKGGGVCALEAHDLNYCLDLIGQECEMPGVELSQDDWIAKIIKENNPSQAAKAKKLFHEKYTQKNIIKSVCDQINTVENPPIEHLILYDWFKNNYLNGNNDDFSKILDKETLSKYKLEAIEFMLDRLDLLSEIPKGNSFFNWF